MRNPLLAITMVAAFALQASAIHIIDAFDSGTFFKTAVSGTINDSLSGLADVIGPGGFPPGQRDVLCTITKSTAQIVQLGVGSGALSLSIPPLANASLRLSYGSYTSLGPLHADLSADEALELTVGFADLSGKVDVTLTAGGHTYSVAGTAIPGGDTSTTFSIPYTSFSGLVSSGDLKHVDGLQFTFSSPSDGWDIEVDRVYSGSPEPSTLTLLALGGLALVRRRRRRR